MTFLEFIDAVRKAGLEWFDRYYSIYPAVVEDVNDPEKRGRIKVSLPSILGEDVVLAQWVLPVGVQIGGDQTGGFFPPYEGDIVDVMFEHGDINFPRYIGGFWAKEELPEFFTAGYGEDGPTVRGWCFKSGQKIIVDETEESLKLQFLNGDEGGYLIFDDTDGAESLFLAHKTGSQLQMTKEGNVTCVTPGGNLLFLNEETGEVTLQTSKGALVSMKEKVTISESGGKNLISITDSTVEVTSSGDVILTAQNVNVKAGNVALGSGAEDNAVLYSKLKSIFDNLSVVTALGPSGPPLPTSTLAFAEAIPPMSAKAGNIRLKGNI